MPVAFHGELANEVADRVDLWTGHAAWTFEPESPVAGFFDDNRDELARVAGAELDGLLVHHDPAAGVDPPPGSDRCPAAAAGAGAWPRPGLR
jgi:hypothetical protein